MEKFMIDGVDKTLKVYDKKVVLTNKKMRGFVFWTILVCLTLSTFIGGIIFWLLWDMANGKEKTIYIKNIKSVELKKPTAMYNGLIQFNLDDTNNYGIDYGNENSVSFKMSEYNKCSEIVEFIEGLII